MNAELDGSLGLKQTLNDCLCSIRCGYSWLVYFCLGLSLVFSLLYLANYFDVSFFVLANRGMSPQSVSSSFFSSFWDNAVWGAAVFFVLLWVLYRVKGSMVSFNHRIIAYLVSLALAGLVLLVVFRVVSVVSLVLASFVLFGLCFVLSRVLFGVSRFGFFARLFFGALVVVLFVELAALVLFSVPLMLNLGLGFSDVALHWRGVWLSLSNLVYPFLPYVYLLFVLFGVAVYAVKVFSVDSLVDRFDAERLKVVLGRLSGWFLLKRNCGLEFLRSRWVVVGAVVVSAVVSCLFVVFTVLPWANPTGMLVSVDAPVYFQWIEYMHSVDVDRALSFAFSNDRALFLVFAYVLSFFVSSSVVLQFVSAVLIVAFGVVSFLVLRLVCWVREVWVLGVLLVPFSFQALGLIYSGYFANMLALILVLAYVVLFFRVLNRWSAVSFFGLLATSVGVLFSHSWTWFIFALSLLMFLFLEWRVSAQGGAGRFRAMVVFVAATLGVGLLCDFSRGLLGPVSSSASVLVTAQSSLGVPNFTFLLCGLQNTVNFVLGGVYAHAALVFLGFVGFLVLIRVKSAVSRFFVSWVFVGCFLILFAAESLVFDRFLFLMPWVLFCGLGLYSVVCGFVGQVGVWRVWLVFLVLSAVFLGLVNFSLGYLFNINIW